VVAIDSRRRVVLMNEGARRILGLSPAAPDSALGADCSEVLAPQPAVAQLLIDALDARNPLSRAELLLERAGGRGQSTIGFTLSPVRDENGCARGAAMIFRDLTPFERMDEQDRLRERLAALGQMAADLAHEIRNPLAGMEVVAGLLRRHLSDRPSELVLVEEIIGELHAVARTVTASLEFVRPVALERRLLDVAALVEDAIATACSRVSFAGKIERIFAPGLAAISADPEQLRSVVTNLVVNAFEAMSAAEGEREHRLVISLRNLDVAGASRPVRVDADGSTATFSEVSGSEILIEIADTGVGVPEELREKVFYPFFTTKQRGSGVGLAVAQKIVASHGGSVELESREGEGTKFRIRLPVTGCEGEAGAPRSASPRVPRALAGGRT
jgi:signal transduction histidine kinase